MESPEAFMPIDRRYAVARGEDLPDRIDGAALFVDISGFTPLTETLIKHLGLRRGVQELTRQLNRVYDVLIGEVHRYGGSVISFSGDAITCWFDGDDGRHATCCAMEIQQVMRPFAQIPTPSGMTISLVVKAAVTAGAALPCGRSKYTTYRRGRRGNPVSYGSCRETGSQR